MCTFCDGSKAKGVVVHTHDHRDLAVLRAAIARDAAFDVEHNLADAPQAGDDVLAIGHPRGFAFTSTRGIVSETSRRLADGVYVQTDVAINPGNSGGPLLDQLGKLVGLNTRIQTDAQGLGFAIGGEEVRAYVLYVLDLIRRRQLHCPTDAEIAAAEKKLTPWDIAAAAVYATGLPHKRAALSDGQPFLSVLTPGRHAVMVTTGGNIFRAAGALAPALTEDQRRDPDLLRRLLGWQTELCGPSFEISGEDLLVVYKRSVQGMDVNEAREAILRVADALDALEKPVRTWLKRR
jgi:hypothetical protein